jgi:hypothetical protein
VYLAQRKCDGLLTGGLVRQGSVGDEDYVQAAQCNLGLMKQVLVTVDDVEIGLSAFNALILCSPNPKVGN